MFVFIRKNTNIFEKQKHLCIFLDFHKTIMQQLESHQNHQLSQAGLTIGNERIVR